jgi:hypothetical protein
MSISILALIVLSPTGPKKRSLLLLEERPQSLESRDHGWEATFEIQYSTKVVIVNFFNMGLDRFCVLAATEDVTDFAGSAAHR